MALVHVCDWCGEQSNDILNVTLPILCRYFNPMDRAIKTIEKFEANNYEICTECAMKIVKCLKSFAPVVFEGKIW